jgi:hypothetical protein
MFGSPLLTLAQKPEGSTKDGFMIEANWVGWRNQHEMTYYFVCNHHNFFFSTYKVNRINGKNPGDAKNWEKKEAKNRAENTHRTILDDEIIWGRNSFRGRAGRSVARGSPTATGTTSPSSTTTTANSFR